MWHDPSTQGRDTQPPRPAHGRLPPPRASAERLQRHRRPRAPLWPRARDRGCRHYCRSPSRSPEKSRNAGPRGEGPAPDSQASRCFFRLWIWRVGFLSLKLVIFFFFFFFVFKIKTEAKLTPWWQGPTSGTACPITASSQPGRRPTPGRGWPGGPWSAGPCAVCPAPGIGLRLQQGPRSPSVGRPGPVGAPRTPLQHSAWSGARARTDTQRWPAPPHHSPFPLLPRVTP